MISSIGRFCGLGALAAVLSILTGCASITNGMDQTIKIETLGAGGKAIDGAICELSNDKGRASAISGQNTLIRRSGANLSVSCALEGQMPAAGQAVSRANAGVAGNLLLGGGIGIAVDVASGAAYTYPAWLQLVFGEERLFDRSDNRGDGPTAGSLVRATQKAAVSTAASSLVSGQTGGTQPPSAAVPVPAVSEGLGPKSPLRRGDILEYELSDRMTGNRAPVLYRLDRIEGDQLVFNMGARIERSDGTLVKLRSPIGGAFESMSPPAGWVGSDVRVGMTWAEEYPRHRFKAQVVGEASFVLEGETLRVLRITYSGWFASPANLAAPMNQPLQIEALYAPDLKRIVQFDAETRAFSSMTRESLRLIRVIRQ